MPNQPQRRCIHRTRSRYGWAISRSPACAHPLRAAKNRRSRSAASLPRCRNRPRARGGRSAAAKKRDAVLDRAALRVGGRRNRAAGCGRRRSPPRTSRKARASRRGRRRRAAASRPPRPPRGSPASRHGRSDRRARACGCRRCASSTPSRTIAAPIGTSPRATAASRLGEARSPSDRARNPSPPSRSPPAAALLCTGP